eukprot:215509-Karenia_brevis.AAC.1
MIAQLTQEGLAGQGRVRLVDPEANTFWTEHGDRTVLNGWAAEMNMPKGQRDMLGQWIPEQSNDYLRTARATVIAIQSK